MGYVRRYAEFHVDASSLRELPNGAIAVQGQITHPGVFRYRGDKGEPRAEYRPESTVFAADAMASFEDMAVTIDHPRGSNGVPRKVTPDTWRGDAVGHMRNVRREGSNVVADLVVHRADAIAGIRGCKLKELSCGYDVAVDETPGQAPDGTKYDAVHTAIRGNHVALLPVGRARGGAECVLRVDGHEAFEPEEASPAPAAASPRESGPVRTLQGKQMDPEHIKAVARADAAEARVTALESELADGARMDALVAERTSLLAAATEAGVEVKDKDGKSLSNAAIKRAIVSKRSPSLASRVDSLDTAGVDIAYAAVMDQPSLKVVAAQVALQATVAGPPGVRADSVDPNRPVSADPARPVAVAREDYASAKGNVSR